MKIKYSAAPFAVTVDTKANILTKTAKSGSIAYATDTNKFYLADGTDWRKMSIEFQIDTSSSDIGIEQDSTKDGYYSTAITDKTIHNSRILENNLTDEGAIRTTTAGTFQVYLNSKWNTVVINFVLKEDSSFGYTFEHQPVGFTKYIEIMSGNSTNDLGLNGLPLIQGYVASMGAYPPTPTLSGGSF